MAEATAQLTDALRRLPELAHAQVLVPDTAAGAQAATAAGTQWYLALDELTDTGVNLRPALAPEMEARPEFVAPPPPVRPLILDALTVVDDPDLFARLETETNLPRFLVPALKGVY